MSEATSPLGPTSVLEDPSSQIDRAWGVVAGAGLLMFVNLGPVLYYTAGVFTKAITDDVGWSRGTIATAALPSNLLITFTLPLVGWAVDVFGTRRVALLSSTLFAIGLILLGQVALTPVLFAISMFFANAAAFGLTPLPYAQIVSGWFDRRRGLALSLMLVMGGFGTAVFPPLSSALIGQFGWRNAYSILGIIVLVIGVSAALALLRDPPQLLNRNCGRTDDTPGLSIPEALTRRPFWILFAAFLLISIAIGGGTTSLPLILTDRGVPAQQAAFIMSIVGIMMIVGRLVLGQLLDRMFAPRLTAVIFLFPALAFCFLLVSPNGTGVILAAALLGFGLGAEVDALAYIASRTFGLRYFGRLFGALMTAFSFGLGLGPTIFGKLFDQTHSYRQAMWIAIAVSVIAGALLTTLRRGDLPFGHDA